jgi:hypothetical protein
MTEGGINGNGKKSSTNVEVSPKVSGFEFGSFLKIESVIRR